VRRVALAALAALMLAGVPAAAGTAVPLEGRGGGLVVEVSLNRRFTGRFLLDTGAAYCVVSKRTARRASLRGRLGGDRVRLITAAGPIDAVLAEARRVAVGRAVARDVTVAVVDREPVPGLDGVLGLSFLERFTYTVDRSGGVLRLGR